MKADHFTLSHSILSTWYAQRIASNLHPIQRGQTRCDAYQAKMSGNTIVRLFSMTKCLVAPWLQHPPLCIFPSEDLDLCLAMEAMSHLEGFARQKTLWLSIVMVVQYQKIEAGLCETVRRSWSRSDFNLSIPSTHITGAGWALALECVQKHRFGTRLIITIFIPV